MTVTAIGARVNKVSKPLKGVNTKNAIEGLLGGQKVETCSDYRSDIISLPLYHPFVAVVDQAYQQHYAISLSPDMFWLLISQGFAKIVNNNAEQMREHFVKHEGKKDIKVRHNGLTKGSLESPWAETFPMFSEKIREEIGNANHGNIVVNFSTTGPVEKAANELVLMDSMQSYFHYTMQTMCGIPEVKLEGDVEDWRRLHAATKALGDSYNIGWVQHLLPILTEIAECANGANRPSLWENFYKISGGSGGPYINGWLVDFFPYVVDYNNNEAVNTLIGKARSGWGGLTHDALPSSLSRIPFKWEYLNTEFSMEFVAGFVGGTQDREGTLRPKIGWAVREKVETRNDSRYRYDGSGDAGILRPR